MSHNIGEKGTVMIEIQNLTKVFQEQTVLQNINATFDAGLIHGVIGMELERQFCFGYCAA